jgi:hypothetical protein
MEKPFLVFSGDQYYPLAGWRDFQGAFATLDEARGHIAHCLKTDWWQIVDVRTLRIVDSE